MNSIPRSVLNEYMLFRFPHAVTYKYDWLHSIYHRTDSDECPDYEDDFVWLTHDVGERKVSCNIPDDAFIDLPDSARCDPVMVKAFEKYLGNENDGEWSIIEIPDGSHVIVVDNGEGRENAFWSSTPIDGTEHPLNSFAISPASCEIEPSDPVSNKGAKATQQAVFDAIQAHTDACMQLARNCIAAAKLDGAVHVKATCKRHPGVRGKLAIETQQSIYDPVKVVFYPFTLSGELSLKPAFVSTELSTYAMLRPNFQQVLENTFEPCE